MAKRAEDRKTYNGVPMDYFVQKCRAIDGAGLNVNLKSENPGDNGSMWFRVHHGMTMTSYGEKITITLTNKKTLTLTVKVADPNAPKAISISAGGKGTTIKKGNTLQLTATVTNPAGAKATFTWTSSNPKVATVGKKTGKVKGVGKGTAIITATPQNGVKKTIKIKVK